MKHAALWIAALLALWLSASLALAEAPAPERCPELSAATPKPVDLNTASEAELLELPGIGPSRARAILAFREAHRGFTNVAQLMRIKGIGRSMFKRLKPLVTLTPLAAPTSPVAADRVR